MEKNIFMRERLYISLSIWLGNVVIWTVLTLFVIEDSLGAGWFWLMFFSAYAIQAIPYWLFLNKNFSDRGRGNLTLVVSMQFLILLGFWILMIVLSLLQASQLKT
ncbi:MAG: hypothetical protein ACYC6B_00060 [Thermoleophilia bacterium]